MNDGKLDTSKSLASAPASRTGGLGSIRLGVRLAFPATAAVAATLPISCDWGLTGCVDPVDLAAVELEPDSGGSATIAGVASSDLRTNPLSLPATSGGVGAGCDGGG